MKKCIKCGIDIPLKRIEILPHTKVCVNCSEVGRKGGITVQLGEGDHTYNEIIIMESTELEQYKTEKVDNQLEYLNDEGETFPAISDIKRNLDYDKEEIEDDLDEYIEEEKKEEEEDDAIS